jgi:hypothetical protein
MNLKQKEVSENCAKIQPTLFIALGGIGAGIALRLRRRILDHSWRSQENPVKINSLDEFPAAQFIYYDLDSSDVAQKNIDQLSRSVAFAADEKIWPSSFFLDPYYFDDQSSQRNPNIDCWLPETPTWIREWINISEKSANHHMPTYEPRFFSRMFFFQEYQQLKHMIQDKINSLLVGVSSRCNIERLGMNMEPTSFRVVVIASTAGSTGSGSFLDMGYLAKWLANMTIQEAKIDLCLMLPSGFHRSNETRSKANTYASLMELETCMRQKIQFVKGWDHHGSVTKLPTRPYDDIFLFDTCNIEGKTAKTDYLFDMVADILFEDFMPSDLTNRKLSIAVNQQQHKILSFSPDVPAKSASMKMMYSKTYSAFGHSIVDMQSEKRSYDISVEQLDDKPLIKRLEEMNPSERINVFRNCLEMAMPWVEANTEGIWIVNSNQYACLIGVNNAKQYEEKFGDEIRTAIPVDTRMTPNEIHFCETDNPYKLTCYVELSGIPLTALRQLPNWKISYGEESKRFPLHLHKDRSLFVHPLVPSSEELDRLAEHFKLYIQGIVLGVLKLRVNDPEQQDYYISVSGEEISIGNERIIRQEGFSNETSEWLKKKISDVLDQIKSPAQYAALAALYEYYSRFAYPPAIKCDEHEMDYKSTGFSNVMCTILMEESLKRLKEKSGFSDTGTTNLIIRLKGAEDSDDWINNEMLETWTDVIESSETDVYESEVGKNHLPKRKLKAEVFDTNWLEALVYFDRNGKEDKKTIKCWWAVIDGQKNGPHDEIGLRKLVSMGKMTIATLVWKKGLSGWVSAEKMNELAGLFELAPPLDEEPSPID